MAHPVTQEGQLLQKISGQLDQLIGLLQGPTQPQATPATQEPDDSTGRVEVRGSDQPTAKTPPPARKRSTSKRQR